MVPEIPSQCLAMASKSNIDVRGVYDLGLTVTCQSKWLNRTAIQVDRFVAISPSSWSSSIEAENLPLSLFPLSVLNNLKLYFSLSLSLSLSLKIICLYILICLRVLFHQYKLTWSLNMLFSCHLLLISSNTVSFLIQLHFTPNWLTLSPFNSNYLPLSQ